MRIVTAAEMRELDRRASEDFGVPSITLMENAGLRTFDVVVKLLSEIEGNRVAVVCGRGNNGGDGFVVARHLHEAGVDVRILLAAGIEDVKGDAKINLQIALNSGIVVKEIKSDEDIRSEFELDDIVVDALFGTGIKGRISGLAAQIIESINGSGRLVASVDLPSGLDADTGQICGTCVQADVTVTFGLPKIGLATFPGAANAGLVNVAAIGIPRAAIESLGVNTFLIEEADVGTKLSLRPIDGHKGTFGHAAVIAGSTGLTGAAAMSSAAAVRAGAGLVTLGIPESLNSVLEAKTTEVMTVPMPETNLGRFSPSAVDDALHLIHNCDAVAIGPGLGKCSETVEFVHKLLPQIKRPMVIDADAINAIALDISIVNRLKAPAILTPHPGEMSRLVGASVEEIQADRLRASRDAAERFGVVMALKGAATVIAEPSGRAWINTTGGVALASGGTGDILTGTILGLLAQGLTPENASICGVFIHGRAGELAEEQIGASGVAASDLLTLIPIAMSRIRKDSR